MSNANRKWHEAMENGLKALCESLNKVGQTATLDMVVRLSVNDVVANELLCLYPKVVTVGEFLARIPAYPIEKNRKRKSRVRDKR
jgi:hypothetical protein